MRALLTLLAFLTLTACKTGTDHGRWSLPTWKDSVERCEYEPTPRDWAVGRQRITLDVASEIRTYFDRLRRPTKTRYTLMVNAVLHAATGQLVERSRTEEVQVLSQDGSRLRRPAMMKFEVDGRRTGVSGYARFTFLDRKSLESVAALQVGNRRIELERRD